MDSLRLYFVTYNVGTSSPDQDLHDLLAIPQSMKNDKNLPDFYIVSLQEVKAKPTNMLLDAMFDDPWTNACRNILAEHDYVKLKSIRLQGLVLTVYSLRKHLLNVRDVESEYTRTGLSGMWGNKGAVSIRLTAYGCSACFVNAHLTPHDEGLNDRVEDYNTIIKDQEFHVPEHTEIFFHDYVFWMGDLNFRLMEEFDKNAEEIAGTVRKGDIGNLFEWDQLRNVMEAGKAFSELTELMPTFPPTFKFEVGSNEYDFKRRPAWTDRILYRVNSNNYENITLKADQKSYKALTDYMLSDHKPVSAEFLIKIPEITLTDMQVFAETSEHTVQFDKIPFWYLDEDNTAVYKFSKDFAKHKDDWIGVFKENFSSLDDYIVYEYVLKSPINASGPMPHTFKYSLTFPDIQLGGESPAVRLVYFNLSDNSVQTVLGVSEPIPLIKRNND